MSRIFFTLALSSTLLLVTTMVLGLNIGEYNRPYQAILKIKSDLKNRDPSTQTIEETEAAKAKIDELIDEMEPMRNRSSFHKMVAILAAIITVLVNSIVVTHFVGTSRWCKEVVTAYSLDNSYAQRSAGIKRQSFPWSLLGVLTTLGIIALGAASDPATLRSDTAKWVLPHQWAAFGGISLIATSYVIQMLKIQDHSALVEEMLEKVRAIRIERGLEVE